MKPSWVKTALATALVLLAFGPSLDHIHKAVVGYGQTGRVAWAIALSVDGLAAYVGLILRDRHRAGLRRWDAVLILLLTVTATVSAQVVTAQRTVGGVIVAVWPALAFLALLALMELDPARKATARTVARVASPAPQKATAVAPTKQVAAKGTPTPPPPVSPQLTAGGTVADRILTALKDAPSTRAALVASTGSTDGTVKKELTALKAKGLIEQDPTRAHHWRAHVTLKAVAQ